MMCKTAAQKLLLELTKKGITLNFKHGYIFEVGVMKINRIFGMEIVSVGGKKSKEAENSIFFS